MQCMRVVYEGITVFIIYLQTVGVMNSQQFSLNSPLILPCFGQNFKLLNSYMIDGTAFGRNSDP